MKPNTFKMFTVIYTKIQRRTLATIIKYQTSGDDILSELKTFRKHPGITQPKAVKLPEALLQNMIQYLEDKPVKQLMPRATAIANYLMRRKRPVEEAELRRKAQSYSAMQGLEDIEEINLQDTSRNNKKKMSSIMNTLRRNVYHWKPVTYDDTVVCAYALSRLAPNYAATYRVLYEIKKSLPSFSPQTVLDFGSGIGTTTWAAHSLWSDSISEYYSVDTSKSMHDLAELLMSETGLSEADDSTTTQPANPLIKGVYYRHFLPMSRQKKYDLIVSAHSLLELPTRVDRLNNLRTLWNKTDHLLVIVEYGTNEGYRTVLEARDYILNDLRDKEEKQAKLRTSKEHEMDPQQFVGHVFSPCPHDLPCPRSDDGTNTPCNFQQDFHSFTKRGPTSDVTSERFCYVVLRKGSRASSGVMNAHWPRIVRPVLPRSRHVVCRLCCPNGQLEDAVISKAKHGRELYRCVRKSKWGDLLPISKENGSSTEDGSIGTDEGMVSEEWTDDEKQTDDDDGVMDNHTDDDEKRMNNEQTDHGKGVNPDRV